jgi:stage II sporulation protein AB (anti-sigma F factor)
MNSTFTVMFDAISENEAFARIIISGFLLPADPLMSEVTEIKTAVSEAVTNCIVHAYNSKTGKIKMSCEVEDKNVKIEIEDYGCGIENTSLARKPMYTTKADEERTGMGFTIMEAFTDSVEVISCRGRGTRVIMKKQLS